MTNNDAQHRDNSSQTPTSLPNGDPAAKTTKSPGGAAIPTRRGRARKRAVAAVVFGSLVALGGATMYAPSASANTGAQVQVVAEDSGSKYVGMSAAQLQKAFLAAPEVQAAIAELKSGDRQPSQGSTAVSAGLASKFGLSVLQIMVDEVGGRVFDETMRALGFEPDEHTEVMRALVEVQESLDLIQAQNQQILEAIEAVHNEVLKANFKKANARVVTASDNISDIMGVIRIWMEDGIAPDQATVTLTVTALREHTTNLRGAAGDPDSGAVPLLLQAYDRNVSDTEQLWEAVAEYRDQVRASLAQGVVGLELLIENWDHPSGEYDASYQTARTTAVNTVDAMYAFGVQTSGPAGQSFLQLENNVAISALVEAGDIPDADRWLWKSGVTTEAIMEPLLSSMVNSYRPANHEGQTLEESLKTRNLPTTYVYPDTWGTRVTYETWALGTRRNVFYTPEVKLAEIRGNTYTTWRVAFGGRVHAGSQDERCTLPWVNCRWEWLNDYRDSANRTMAIELDQWSKASQGQASSRLAQWINESNRHHNSQAGVTFSALSNGISGFLTDTRPEAIREAAYGITQ
jgi:hypothetical protein